MPSSDPTPGRPSDARIQLSFTYLSVLTGLSFLVTLFLFGGTGWRGGKFGLLFTLLLVLILAYGGPVRMWREHRHEAIDLIERGGEPGTRLRYSGYLATVIVLIMLTMAALLAFVASDSVRYGDGHPGSWAAAITFAVSATWLASWPILRLAGGIARGELTLTTREICFRGRTVLATAQWDSVLSVSLDEDHTVMIHIRPEKAWDRRRTAWPWRSDRFMWGSQPDWIVFDCLASELDELVVCGLIDFYHRHPEARDELGTEASLDRARELARRAGLPA